MQIVNTLSLKVIKDSTTPKLKVYAIDEGASLKVIKDSTTPKLRYFL